MSNTFFIGKVYLRFDELPSTNDYAAELLAADAKGLAKSKPVHGMVIRTDKQSAGHGQFGSHWESAPGQNLTLSVIVYPVWLAVKRQFDLSMAAALALSDLLDEYLPAERVRIKWPNDLYAGDGKIAGILIQNSISRNQIKNSIIGIGLNVNQIQFFSDAPNPTSLAIQTGRTFDLDTVADRLLECLEARYNALEHISYEGLKAEYEARLYRINQPADYQRTADDTVFTAILRGVEPDGRLRLEVGKKEARFDVKAIEFRQ